MAMLPTQTCQYYNQVNGLGFATLIRSNSSFKMVILNHVKPFILKINSIRLVHFILSMIQTSSLASYRLTWPAIVGEDET